MAAAAAFKKTNDEGKNSGESMFTFSGFVPPNRADATSGSAIAADPLAMLFTIPRSYRALGAAGSTAELDSFLDLCKAALAQTRGLVVAGRQVQMVLLHPLMINPLGQPNYFRRAPHPAILFYLQP